MGVEFESRILVVLAFVSTQKGNGVALGMNADSRGWPITDEALMIHNNKFRNKSMQRVVQHVCISIFQSEILEFILCLGGDELRHLFRIWVLLEVARILI